MNRLFLVLLAVLLIGGCKSDDKLGDALGDLGNDQLGVSVLAVNLRDIYNVPKRQSGTTWQERYKKIATWMGNTSTLPDIIALQEAPGFWECRRTLPDYAGIDFLLDEIRNATGQQYRIAYLVSHKVGGGEGDGWIGSEGTGGCRARGGRALLYRPSTMRNAQELQTETPFAYDDERHTGPHLISSLPCCDPAATRTDVCTFIDGPAHTARCERPEPKNRLLPSGAAWTKRQSATERNFDAVFARLQHIRSGNYLHVYNVHLKHTGGGALEHARPATRSINELVDAMERRFARTPTDLLYPPILVGDFNINRVDASGEFPRFRDVLWANHPDVMGAMFGREEVFPAKQAAFINATQLLPGPGCEFEGGDRVTLWSDHCGLFFRIQPVRP